MSRRVFLAVGLVVGLSLQAAVAQPARGQGAAVVDFYAQSPLPPVEGIIPEELAADDLANLLARAAGASMRVLPRGTVRQAESALQWKRSDVLRFARLRDLGRAVGADRLLVGWIERMDLDQGGGGGGQGAGVGRYFGFATIRVQVFDPKQGRIMFQVEESAYEIGMIRARVAERLLLHVLERTLPSLLPVL